MGREIKFRARDLKKMRYKTHTEDMAIVIGSPNPQAKLSEMKLCSAEHVVLEQYTGLKDKNGVEIYEGDIVQVVYRESKPIGPGVIVFSSCSIASDDWGGDISTPCFCISWDGGYSPFGSEHTEVIGNIHSNPELLNEHS